MHRPFLAGAFVFAAIIPQIVAAQQSPAPSSSPAKSSPSSSSTARPRTSGTSRPQTGGTAQPARHNASSRPSSNSRHANHGNRGGAAPYGGVIVNGVNVQQMTSPTPKPPGPNKIVKPEATVFKSIGN